MKTKEQMKKEAIKAMKIMGINEEYINAFNDNDTILTAESHYSSREALHGIYRDEEFEEIAHTVEKENGGVVYYMTFNETDFGDLISMFYISPYEEDTAYMEDDLKDKITFCWVENLSVPEHSEFGSIGFRNVGGFVVRTE